jgi:hypothetical protein
MDLHNLGRVPRDIKYVPGRFPYRLGHLETESLILKQYTIKLLSKKLGSRILKKSQDYLEEQISEGKIDTGIGFGFSILSYAVAQKYSAYLNVCVWHREFPTFLTNRLFLIDSENPHNIHESATINGGIPMWALGIYEHEKKAWRKYLESKIVVEGDVEREEGRELFIPTQRSESAKRQYLEDFGVNSSYD